MRLSIVGCSVIMLGSPVIMMRTILGGGLSCWRFPFGAQGTRNGTVDKHHWSNEAEFSWLTHVHAKGK